MFENWIIFWWLLVEKEQSIFLLSYLETRVSHSQTIPILIWKGKSWESEEKKKTVDAAKLSEKLRYRVIGCRMFMQGITPAWIPTLSLDLYRYFFRLLDWKIPLIIEHRTTRSLFQIMERWILILCFNLVATRPIRFLPLRGEDQGMLRIQD